MLADNIINELAHKVVSAQDGAHTMEKLTIAYPEMEMADSYRVQDALRNIWIARGEKVVGLKAGLTSKAKMEQMGVHEPSFGILTSRMAVPENGIVKMTELVHPRVEAEIAFVMERELRGTHHSINDIIQATDFVIPAVEIIDSRYEKFKFDLVSVIADNGSSSRYVTGGKPRDPKQGMDLQTIGVVIEKNGEIVALGASAAVLGHPVKAIQMLLEHLDARGESLPAGSIVLTGGITEAIAVEVGDSINARFQDLGSITIKFGE
ncbi:2-oxo-3-hexenedioate decarboxylase [Zhongshania marina]|uniref:2-oxo-3-hexenedioate decarboxylase n=1 Tax=Zhongshania marina TaxID=2304603 RepID=A0A2S4HKF9_9GAMM|nr:2-oxo-3-hexenedioate decarboxylase [Marortus luteolus]POP54478.1 2-oxo-3-hexenedioate decarboxylase [Marortus luteolus]